MLVASQGQPRAAGWHWRGSRAGSTTDRPTYVVADPDPDGTDSFQFTVSLLEQVTHQLVQATLDHHLGSGEGELHQDGKGLWGSLTPVTYSQPCLSFRQGTAAAWTRLARGDGQGELCQLSDPWAASFCRFFLNILGPARRACGGGACSSSEPRSALSQTIYRFDSVRIRGLHASHVALVCQLSWARKELKVSVDEHGSGRGGSASVWRLPWSSTSSLYRYFPTSWVGHGTAIAVLKWDVGWGESQCWAGHRGLPLGGWWAVGGEWKGF